MKHSLGVRWATSLLPIAVALSCSLAGAQDITCSASMSNLAFGTVNPQSSLTTANATLAWSCTNSSSKTRSGRVCFSIGEPGGAQVYPRLMHDASNNDLQFQIYQDPARSIIWGSNFFGSPTPLEVTVVLAKNASTNGQATMYGLVLNNQVTAVPGSYTRVYQSGDTALTVNQSTTSTPPSSCTTASILDYFPFNVSATVAKQCSVSATALNFGTVALLSGNTPGTSTLSVQCANGSAYNVGLDSGQNSASISSRKMLMGTNAVSYQLYSNSARTVTWGNTVGTNTVGGTGTGSTQNFTVYGSVPPQTTPPAGVYQDTITITVTY